MGSCVVTPHCSSAIWFARTVGSIYNVRMNSAERLTGYLAALLMSQPSGTRVCGLRIP